MLFSSSFPLSILRVFFQKGFACLKRNKPILVFNNSLLESKDDTFRLHIMRCRILSSWRQPSKGCQRPNWIDLMIHYSHFSYGKIQFQAGHELINDVKYFVNKQLTGKTHAKSQDLEAKNLMSTNQQHQDASENKQTLCFN